MQEELQQSKAAAALGQSQDRIRLSVTNSRPVLYMQPSKAEVSVKSSRLSECFNVKISDAGIVGSRFRGGKSTDNWRNHKPACIVQQQLGKEKFGEYWWVSPVLAHIIINEIINYEINRAYLTAQWL